ncbi:MAG TPA: SpvB/TcaC N-terminal domain-containing protein [Blastocatellia bacterium]|nr:SpvB/TcaC N-terminal domain-containing protein [Blastocatellia bacterium]
MIDQRAEKRIRGTGQEGRREDTNRQDTQSAKTSQFSAPSISLPKGGGAIRGIGEKFAANPVTGTGSMTVPISTTSGRSGFTPQLALSYDSGSGNGQFGLGWSLSLPEITRKTDKGLPTYQDAEESDVFILSGAEDLVPALIQDGDDWRPDLSELTVDGMSYRIIRYRPRIEGLFARIERWTNLETGATHWRTISKENVTTFYGRTAESRIADPADPRRVFTWLICESRDDKGNAIVYQYAAENLDNIDLTQANENNRTADSRSADRYLKRIKYGNRISHLIKPDLSQTDWLFEVVFDYDEGHYEALAPDAGVRQLARAHSAGTRDWSTRSDPFSTFRAGFEVRTYRLCRRTLMFHHMPEDLGAEDYLIGSTEFTYDETPIASFMTSATQSGYVRQDDDIYLKRSLPPLEFDYSEAVIQNRIHEVDAESLENLPYGLDGGRYQWTDLDGEGISGILTEQSGAWFYKPNIGDGRFGPMEVVRFTPSIANLNGGQQLMDLAGDGQLDLVEFATPLAGFYERTFERGWKDFAPFHSIPDLDWHSPYLKFIDLTGDGQPDILIAEDEVFTWYPSLAEAGFGAGQRTRQPFDEEKGPRLIFADATESMFLADLSGDGLADLVRIRNGEVSYWPNLGYGRFGAKVTMDKSPRFDAPDQFDQQRIRLADIDGSGVTDIIYLGRNGVDLYFNQAGNSWSEARKLDIFPSVDDSLSVTVTDLRGDGTACLVWSSPLPGDVRRPMRYVELMKQKPHLMIGTKNNLGAETRVKYAASTKFYLADKAAGNPWITRLPFPVHVVERVETLDRVSRNRFVTRYVYHHGCFDGVEREFRGFGMVEQLDTEEFASLSQSGDFPGATNIDAASHVPPVLTKTWVHTGAYFERRRISKQFEHEYYREGDPSLGEGELSDEQLEAMLLLDTVLPDGLTAEEEREACRSLKGAILRQEVYALDRKEESDRPYSASERNYTVKRIQPAGGNRHAVFLTHERETIDFHYERKLYDIAGQRRADPRVTHNAVLEVDPYGNTLKAVAIGYGRRFDDPDPLLTAADRAIQRAIMLTLTENHYTNTVQETGAYRAPLLCESRSYELINVTPGANQPGITNLFRFQELADKLSAAGDGQHDLPYEDVDGSGATANQPYRRLIEYVRMLYRSDDLSAPLSLGQLQSLALPFESYKLAFTPGLLQQVYGDRLTEAMLSADGRYVHNDGDANWWIPSGRIFFSPNASDTAAQELDAARRHFFMPRRFLDPFGGATTVSYDSHDLAMVETRDALGNTVQSENDYRVMQPSLVTDPNGNRAAVSFDALGMVTGTAVMGKESESLGDSLGGFETDPEEATIIAHLGNPFADPHTILSHAATRLIYDLFAYHRTREDERPAPNVVYTLARETHDADLSPGEQTRIQHAFSYSDGFGREIQMKVQAEPGPIIEGGPAVNPRWVGSGWTVFNNKGNPVRQFEPFFTDTHRFEFDVRIGVSPVLFYDPAARVVATLHPNHSWEKVVFDPWRQESWDVSDSALIAEPRTDPDAGDFFDRLDESEYLPTWHAQRQGGTLGPEEQGAAAKAAMHAGTPSVAHADSLGRTFLTIAHNRFKRSDTPPADPPTEEFYSTRVVFDIEGNQREVIDANDRIVMRYDYDMLGTRIHQASMEAGERWMLNDVTGQPIRAWDSRGHHFRTEYDTLRRPLLSFVQGADPQNPSIEILFGKLEYGEGQPNDIQLNMRGKPFRQYDSAGVMTTEAYDFKGNMLRSIRRLARNYRTIPDWATNPGLEQQTFTGSTTYDALNRPVSVTAPDQSIYRPTYNEANMLERVEVYLRGAQSATPFVTNIDYNAKGQRTLIDYGNSVKTSYAYDPLTFRLTRLQTLRGAERLQDLSYTYDPTGNITQIADGAQQTIFFNNQVVSPSNDYTYDAVYRLINAEGREHIGQASQPQVTWDDRFRVRLPHPNDGQAMRRYHEMYSYDPVGNFLQLIHEAVDGNWTRSYSYNEPSLIESDRQNNRLSSTEVGSNNKITEAYAHDEHGNMIEMPHLPLMQWNFKDQLSATSRQVVNNGTPETTYYVYDGAGQRTRKVTERQNGTRKNERVYLGGFEIYREYDATGNNVTLERETLQVMDDKQRLAIVETRTQGSDGSPGQLIRYQFSNHLGSASLELDNTGQVISYEEYYAYGSTSYQAGRSAVDVGLKRYRYTGKERDEETGFAYYGFRYCAIWLSRWISADPTFLRDGLNLYRFTRANPVTLLDLLGTDSRTTLVEDFGAVVYTRHKYNSVDPIRLGGGQVGNAFVELFIDLGARTYKNCPANVSTEELFDKGADIFAARFGLQREYRGAVREGTMEYVRNSEKQKYRTDEVIFSGHELLYSGEMTKKEQESLNDARARYRSAGFKIVSDLIGNFGGVEGTEAPSSGGRQSQHGAPLEPVSIKAMASPIEPLPAPAKAATEGTKAAAGEPPPPSPPAGGGGGGIPGGGGAPGGGGGIPEPAASHLEVLQAEVLQHLPNGRLAARVINRGGANPISLRQARDILKGARLLQREGLLTEVGHLDALYEILPRLYPNKDWLPRFRVPGRSQDAFGHAADRIFQGLPDPGPRWRNHF